MTRIDLAKVETFTDQHLVSGYKEIMRLPGYLKRSLKSKRGVPVDSIPPVFTLNTGHVRFFYNKGRFIRDKFRAIRWEMIRRGYRPTITDLDFSQWPEHLMGGYIPTPQDLAVSRQRVDDKLRNTKPGFVYTFWGQPLDPQWGVDFLGMVTPPPIPQGYPNDPRPFKELPLRA